MNSENFKITRITHTCQCIVHQINCWSFRSSIEFSISPERVKRKTLGLTNKLKKVCFKKPLHAQRLLLNNIFKHLESQQRSIHNVNDCTYDEFCGPVSNSTYTYKNKAEGRKKIKLQIRPLTKHLGNKCSNPECKESTRNSWGWPNLNIYTPTRFNNNPPFVLLLHLCFLKNNLRRMMHSWVFKQMSITNIQGL